MGSNMFQKKVSWFQKMFGRTVELKFFPFPLGSRPERRNAVPLLWRGPLLQGMQTLPSKGTKTGCWQLCWLPHLRPSPCHNSKKIGGESGVEVLVFDGATGPSCIGELGAPGPSGTSNDEGAVAPFFSHRPKSGLELEKSLRPSSSKSFSGPTRGKLGFKTERQPTYWRSSWRWRGTKIITCGDSCRSSWAWCITWSSTGRLFHRWATHSSTNFWHEMARLSFVLALS